MPQVVEKRKKGAGRHAQLQALLGEAGQVFPFTSQTDATRPTPGWYAQLNNGHAKHAKGLWIAADGAIYLGYDLPHASVTIGRLLNV